MANIQIIDDSETLRTQLRQTLEQGGHQVQEAYDGLNALEVLQANPSVSLIICDLNMPRMDGLSFCRKVKETPEYSNIPIFILTTEVNPELKTQAKALGVRGWIIKPFTADKLLSAVTQVLR